MSKKINNTKEEKNKDHKELTELWNILNARKECLLSEIYSIENMMGLIEIRTNTEKSNKLMDRIKR